MIDIFEMNKTLLIDESQDFLFINNQSNHQKKIFDFLKSSNKNDGFTKIPVVTISNSTNMTEICSIEPKIFLEEQIIYLCLICPLAAIGIILNILSIKVFNDKSFNTVAFCYLRLMTVFDLLICLIMIVYCLTGYTNAFNQYDFFIRNLYLAYIYIPLANICSNLATLMKLLVTFERLVSIRWPTKKYQLFKKSRYYLSCIIVALVSITFNFLYFFLYEVTMCSLKPQKFIVQTIFWKVFGYIKEILMRVMPIFLLTGANALLIYTVKMSRKRMEKNIKNKTTNDAVDVAANRRSRQDNQLTSMTITVALMYSICSVPMVFAYPGLVFKNEELLSKKYRIYAALVNTLELMQSSFRFVIFYSFTTQFRQIFKSKYSSICCSNSYKSSKTPENESQVNNGLLTKHVRVSTSPKLTRLE
jgi:hypothetical protein